MQAMWISWKENIKCGNNVGDVVRPTKLLKRKTSIFDNLTEGLTSQHNIYFYPKHTQWNCRQSSEIQKIDTEKKYKKRYEEMHPPLCELQSGDPSRNIVEMIFQASSSAKHFKKIHRVLRVNNPRDTIDRFEKYREAVMKRCHEQGNKRHPRSTVDGNELLRFYGTTMACCSGKTNELSNICRHPNCRVCRLIQSCFNTSYNKLNGIRLSSSSDEVSEDTSAVTKGKNLKRAAIICRAIAGRLVGVDNDGCGEEHDSVGDKCLIVRNPSAVLPCFVVIFQ